MRKGVADRDTSFRKVSLRAGYSHSALWKWAKTHGPVDLNTALCYLRVLGYRVTLTPDLKPLV